MEGSERDSIPVITALARVAGVASLVAAAVHAAATKVHYDDEVLFGIGFATMAVLQALCGIVLLVWPRRRLLLGAGALSLGIVGLWVVSRTVGIAGFDSPAEAESVGIADGVATGSAAIVVLCAIVALTGVRRTQVTRVPAFAASAVAIVALVAFAVPAVKAAPEHDHGDGGHHGDSEEAAHAHGSGDHHDMSDEEMAAMSNSDKAGEHDDGHGHEHDSDVIIFGEEDHHAGPPCEATEEQKAAGDKLVEETRAGMARLADIKTAEAEGYMRFGDIDIYGTWHYINWKYQVDDDVLNPDKPESIIYWQASPESPLILIGAMYVVPEVGDKGPEVGGCLTKWHVHGPPFSTREELTPEMLHVWTIPMPDGPFV